MLRLARLSLALLALLAPAAPAQGELDQQWVKIKVKAKGFTLDGDGVVTKASFTTTVYMHLEADGALYDYSITYEQAPGVFETSLLQVLSPTGEDDNVVVNHTFDLTSFGNELSLQTTFRFKFKLDAQGALKKATLKSDSGHIVSGTLGGLQFFGSVTFTGVTVPTSKLPFEM